MLLFSWSFYSKTNNEMLQIESFQNLKNTMKQNRVIQQRETNGRGGKGLRAALGAQRRSIWWNNSWTESWTFGSQPRESLREKHSRRGKSTPAEGKALQQREEAVGRSQCPSPCSPTSAPPLPCWVLPAPHLGTLDLHHQRCHLPTQIYYFFKKPLLQETSNEQLLLILTTPCFTSNVCAWPW